MDECARRLGSGHHGDAARWLNALATLPDVMPSASSFGATVKIGAPEDLSAVQSEPLITALSDLHPWRKGPFEFFGAHIDTEWRSDWKWDRVSAGIGTLDGARILDIGAGNGYYGWRMLAAGAQFVLGIDPTIAFNMQYHAAAHFLPTAAQTNVLLPLRLEELPSGPRFDCIFSMGVIYHRRDPQAHLLKICEHLEPGGRVILETLIVESESKTGLVPDGRYARMRNVWMVPTTELVESWLLEAGLVQPEVISIERTTIEEQRSTAWMTFESLAASLDPVNPKLTVEGHPAPIRAVFIATLPG